MNLNRTSLVVNRKEQWLLSKDSVLVSDGDVLTAPYSPSLPIIKHIDLTSLDAGMEAVRVDHCGAFVGINKKSTGIIKIEPGDIVNKPEEAVTDIYDVGSINRKIIQFSISPFYICFIDDFGIVYILRYDSKASTVELLDKFSAGDIIGLDVGMKELYLLCKTNDSGKPEIRIFDCLSGGEIGKAEVDIEAPDSIYRSRTMWCVASVAIVSRD